MSKFQVSIITYCRSRLRFHGSTRAATKNYVHLSLNSIRGGPLLGRSFVLSYLITTKNKFYEIKQFNRSKQMQMFMY